MLLTEKKALEKSLQKAEKSYHQDLFVQGLLPRHERHRSCNNSPLVQVVTHCHKELHIRCLNSPRFTPYDMLLVHGKTHR